MLLMIMDPASQLSKSLRADLRSIVLATIDDFPSNWQVELDPGSGSLSFSAGTEVIHR